MLIFGSEIRVGGHPKVDEPHVDPTSPNLQADVLRIDVEVRNPPRMKRLDPMQCLLE
jgi:hypothetical protein